MRKGIAILFILFAIAVSATANTIIFKDQAGRINLYTNSNHYQSNDISSNFALIKKVAETTKEVIFSQDKNEISAAFVSNESLSIIYSKDYGLNFKRINTSAKLKNADIKHYLLKNSTTHIVYRIKDEHYYIHSADNGLSFSPPLLLNNESAAVKSDFITNDNLTAFALLDKDNKAVLCSKSINNGLSFSKSEIKRPGFDQFQDIALFFDNGNSLHLLAVATDKNNYKLYHYKQNEGQWERNLLYESSEKIYDLKALSLKETNAQILTYQSGKNRVFWALSVDNGKNISAPQEILLQDTTMQTIFYDNQKLYFVSDKGLNEIQNSAPAKTYIVSPKNQTSIRGTTLKFKLKSEDIDENELLYKIDLSLDKDFIQDTLLSYTTSSEASINIPFTSGRFYIMASACDGIARGEYSPPVEINIDNQSPTIERIEYPQSINTNNFNVKIVFSEPITYESGSIFSLENLSSKKPLVIKELFADTASIEAKLEIPSLDEGTYSLKINNISDQAGNPLATKKQLTVSVDRKSPMVNIIQPHSGNWFKASANILIEANISDLQNDIASNPQITLLIDKQLLKTTGFYNKNNKKLMGFFTVPDGVTNGKHNLELSILDNAGHAGSAKTSLMIDSSPPKAAPPNSPSGEKKKINISFVEGGSGLDRESSIFQVTYSSKEVNGTIEAYENSIIFYPQSELVDGKYNINISLRDKAGNSASPLHFIIEIQDGFSSKDIENKSGSTASLRYGPNPFDPQKEAWKLQYSLSSASEANFFVFTLTGRNVNRAFSSSSTLHNISWDGLDQFGKIVPNGVYLFAIVRGGLTSSEIQRGRIIVLR